MSEVHHVYPKDWTVWSLESVASRITSGGTPTSGNPRYYIENGGTPFAKTEDLTRAKSKFIEKCELAISATALKETTAKIYPTGTILISMYGTIGLTKIAAMELAANQALCALIPPLACSPGYLYHHLNYIRPQWTKYSGQTTQANINSAAIRAHEVSLPRVDEQHMIANVLDTIDTAIHETEAIIAKLKAVKQGLLHDLLTRGIDANGELRPPQAEAPHLYKQSPLGWIPKDWEDKNVGTCCEIHNGLRLPIASEIRGRMQGVYPYYGPTGVLDYLNEYRLSGTFVLIGEDGDHFLKFAEWPMTQLISGQFNVNNHAHVLTGRTCATDWIDIWFRHRDITFFLTRQGAGRFKLNKASLMGLPMAVPAATEQEKIAVALTAFDVHLNSEIQKTRKLKVLKSGLMEDLLTGRVRVTPLLAAEQQRSA